MMQKLKDLVNNHSGVVIVVVILALGVAVWSAIGHIGGGGPSLGAKTAFYSDDDGQTWFKDNAPLTTPFDHGGKPACLAHVFRCKDKEFVGYLEKSGDKLVSRDEAAPAPAAAGAKDEAAAKRAAAAGGIGSGFVKKPGAKDWVSRGNFRRAATEMSVACEGVAPTDIELVMP